MAKPFPLGTAPGPSWPLSPLTSPSGFSHASSSNSTSSANIMTPREGYDAWKEAWRPAKRHDRFPSVVSVCSEDFSDTYSFMGAKNGGAIHGKAAKSSVSQSVFDDPKAARQPSATVEFTKSELNNLLVAIDRDWISEARKKSLKELVNKAFGRVQDSPATSEPKSPRFEPSPSSCSFNRKSPVDQVSHLGPTIHSPARARTIHLRWMRYHFSSERFRSTFESFPIDSVSRNQAQGCAFPFLFPNHENNSVMDGAAGQYLNAARTYSETLEKMCHPKNAQQAQKKRADVSKRHDPDVHSSTIDKATSSFAGQQLDWENRISKLERQLNVTKCVHCGESLTPTCKRKENTWIASQVGKHAAEMERLNDRFVEQLATQFEALGIDPPNPQQSAAAKSSQERIDKLQGEIEDLKDENRWLCNDNERLRVLSKSHYAADSHDVRDWYNGDWSDCGDDGVSKSKKAGGPRDTWVDEDKNGWGFARAPFKPQGLGTTRN